MSIYRLWVSPAKCSLWMGDFLCLVSRRLHIAPAHSTHSPQSCKTLILCVAINIHCCHTLCSVTKMAEVLRQAIEKEEKLLYKLVLSGASFHINEVKYL